MGHVFCWTPMATLHRVGDPACPACCSLPWAPAPMVHGPCRGLVHREILEGDPPPWPATTTRCDVCRERAPEPRPWADAFGSRPRVA